jgi:hypothetical protein
MIAARANARRGVVVLAALGVMAVTIILAFAMAGSTEFSYHRTASTLREAQEDALAQSVLDYVRLQSARGRLQPDGEPYSLHVDTDSILRRAIEAQVQVRTIRPDHEGYRRAALDHRPGDVLIVIDPRTVRGGPELNQRLLLYNLEGRRRRPFDLSRILRAPKAQQ